MVDPWAIVLIPLVPGLLEPCELERPPGGWGGAVDAVSYREPVQVTVRDGAESPQALPVYWAGRR